MSRTTNLGVGVAPPARERKSEHALGRLRDDRSAMFTGPRYRVAVANGLERFQAAESANEFLPPAGSSARG
ncbi:MAG: hypothetical protein ABIZ81_16650 [Opitutaceae bacterium]